MEREKVKITIEVEKHKDKNGLPTCYGCDFLRCDNENEDDNYCVIDSVGCLNRKNNSTSPAYNCPVWKDHLCMIDHKFPSSTDSDGKSYVKQGTLCHCGETRAEIRVEAKKIGK